MDRRKLIDKVAAQYLGKGVEDLDVPWMEYVQKKTESPEGLGDATRMTEDMLKLSPGKGRGDNSRADNQLRPDNFDDSQDVFSLKEYGGDTTFYHDDVLEGEGGIFPVEYTRPDKQEQPDSSLRMYWINKHRQDEATGNPWGSNLYGEGANVSVLEASDKGISKKAFKTIHQVMDSSIHPRSEKVKEDGMSLDPKDISDVDEKRQGIFTFSVPGKDGEHTVKLQMLKAEGKENLLEHPCLIACDCKDFLWGGPQYYAVQGKYMYTPMLRPQVIEPRDTNQGGRGKGLTICKHVAAVASHLSDLNIDEDYTEDLKSQLLELNPSEDIKELEKNVPMDSKTKFIRFLELGKLNAPVLERARKSLKKQGISEHQMYDYVQGPFAQESVGVQKRIIEMLGTKPDTIIFLLLEFKKAFGDIPGYLSEAAYKTLEKIL